MLGVVSRASCEFGQGEIDVVAAIDRQVLDARLVDGGARRGLLGLDQFGFGGDGNGFACGGHRQRHRQFCDLADGADEPISFTSLANPGASTVTEYNSGGQRQQDRHPSALVVAARENPRPGLGGGDRGVANHRALGVFDDDVQFGSLHLRHGAGQQACDCDQQAQESAHEVHDVPF